MMFYRVALIVIVLIASVGVGYLAAAIISPWQ